MPTLPYVHWVSPWGLGGLEGGKAELGREKELVLCEGPCSENRVAGGLDLGRLLPFGTFFYCCWFYHLGLKKKKKKKKPPYVLILTKLLIFYRMSVSRARCRKSMSFFKGKSACSVLSV